MTRQAAINKGRVWQISPDSDSDKILFEGTSKTACIKWLKDNHKWTDYKVGFLRIGQVILEF